MKNEQWKYIWNTELFQDAFCQLGKIGKWMAGFLILKQVATSIWLGTGYSGAKLIDILWMQLEDESGMPIICLVAAPVMIFYLFSFLNKRSGSDFYHAIPTKRIAVCLSKCAAVLASQLLIIGACGIVYVVGWALIGADLDSAVFAGLLIRCEYMAAGAVLVTGAALCAVSLTGTLFSNVFLFFLILLLPRMVLSMITVGVREALPMVPAASDMAVKLLNGGWQIFFEMLFGSAGGTIWYSSEKVPVASAIAYSMVLGVIYLAGGTMFFCKRKSEAAKKQGVNTVIQVLLQIAVPLLITIPATTMLVNVMTHRVTTVKISRAVLLYMLGILIFFLFRLFVSRSIREMAKSVRFLPLPAALNLLYCVLLVQAVVSVINTTPAAEEISEVYISQESLEGLEEYAGQLSEIPLSEEEARAFVSEKLRAMMEKFADNPDTYAAYKAYKYKVNLAINTEQKTINREFYLSLTEYQSLIGYLSEEAAKDPSLVLLLPDTGEMEQVLKSEEHVYYQDYFITFLEGRTCKVIPGICTWEFTEEEFEKVYTCLQEEYKETRQPLQSYMGRYYNEYNYTIFDYVDMVLYDENREYDRSCAWPISVSTPETVETLAAVCNEKWADHDFREFADEVQTGQRGTYEEDGFTFLLYDKNDAGSLKYNTVLWDNMHDGMEAEKLAALAALLSGHQEQDISMEENVLYLTWYKNKNINATVEDLNTGMTVYNTLDGPYGHWYNLSDTEVAKLKELLDCNKQFHYGSYSAYGRYSDYSIMRFDGTGFQSE